MNKNKGYMHEDFIPLGPMVIYIVNIYLCKIRCLLEK